ncbi:MAG TPA: glycosyltransferase [Gaiellaceae bacterium]|nr:glycosyltransferase [Gaiellaceae bacterium]
MRIVVLGLSITSSWGNGHATNYRALLRALRERGHDVLFLERDMPWYAAARDWDAPFVRLYGSVEELQERWEAEVRGADLVVVGSYVPAGVAVGSWVQRVAGGVTAFYDIDTPVTVAKLERGDTEYLAPELVGGYDLYLSFTGGPLLERLEDEFGAPRARAFHCLVDPDAYRPLDVERRWELGYLGTYSDDRQPAVEALLVEPARRQPDARFCAGGPGYPEWVRWPGNVERIDHLPPAEHPSFYGAQAFTLNVTRRDMVRAGWSPSVRLFEAAACGVPVISDWWEGLDAFFEPGREIVVAEGTDDVLRALREVGEEERRAIGRRARERVLAEHTAAHRARELEEHVAELMGARR